MLLAFVWYWLGIACLPIAAGMIVIALSRGQRLALNGCAVALVTVGVGFAALSVAREPWFVLLFALALGLPVGVANLLGARFGASGKNIT